MEQDNTYYNGWLVDGVRHGFGIQTGSREIYKGNWINDKPEGHGVIEYLDKSTYNGQFFDGLRHGTGNYNYIDGS